MLQFYAYWAKIIYFASRWRDIPSSPNFTWNELYFSKQQGKAIIKRRVRQRFSADVPSLVWLTAQQIALAMGRNGLETQKIYSPLVFRDLLVIGSTQWFCTDDWVRFLGLWAMDFVCCGFRLPLILWVGMDFSNMPMRDSCKISWLQGTMSLPTFTKCVHKLKSRSALEMCCKTIPGATNMWQFPSVS